MIIAPTLRVLALFWTLCVLLTTQSVENCIPTLECGTMFSDYRANAPRTSVEFICQPTVTSDIPRHENRCP